MAEAVRVPIRRLQQHASELIAEVEAGRRVEITRNGRLVAVLAPPDPEQAAWERLVDRGAVDPAADKVGGLAGWPTPRGTPSHRLTETLTALRDEEGER
ncbi:MAG TPA: type II toxin-antitoxin system prevent-host-death family antitoxin [Rugosimonospora sp.]|nr:type II toxin-antitoxin system prevent-host-death family antitoxin [Rugosimonospora sp.]